MTAHMVYEPEPHQRLMVFVDGTNILQESSKELKIELIMTNSPCSKKTGKDLTKTVDDTEPMVSPKAKLEATDLEIQEYVAALEAENLKMTKKIGKLQAENTTLKNRNKVLVKENEKNKREPIHTDISLLGKYTRKI